MSDRKRINISVSPQTYAMLTDMQRQNGFSSLCEMIVAMVNVVASRMGKADVVDDIPEDDSAYIDQMFNEFANTYKLPDGNPPKRHPRKSIGDGER